MSTGKRNVLGLTAEELGRFAESLGEPRFRGEQIFGWLYKRNVSDFGAMTDLGATFRNRLREVAAIEELSLLEESVSAADGTRKFLFATPAGGRIESVLIPPRSAFSGPGASVEEEQRRLTLCLSTQVGCPLDCAFCATGTMGFFRNLTTGEIVDQMRQVMRGTGQRVSNIVFMGMGEPLLNYARMMDAVRILGEGPGIAQRRITISTAGWVHGILRLAEERRTVRLAVSLHAASDEKRSVLMPVNRRYPLARLQGALQTYTRAVRRRVTFECVFFDGVNDTPEDIDRLISFARRVPCKINVIPFHPIAFASPAAFASGLRRSPRLDEIVARLRSAGLRVMMRSSAGEDITAACGQLAVKQDRARTGAPRGHVHATSALPEPSQA